MDRDRRLLLGAALSAAAVPSSAAAQFGVPRPEDVLRRARDRAVQEGREAAEGAVARALFPMEADSAAFRPMAPNLDRIDFGPFGDMTTLPRTSTGGFVLRPGCWEFRAESYCLMAGAYERTGGSGYRSGELTGRIGQPVQAILANVYAHPSLPRTDVQSLLWGVLAGVEIRNQSPGAQRAAALLLTPQQLGDLNGGLAGFAPPQLTSRALAELPPSVRAAYDAQRRMRDIAGRPRTTFADMEAVAVLRGNPPNTADDVPSGRWNSHPGGFCIRYASESYSRTTVQIVVGERARVRRDGQNRIIEMSFADGAYVRASYHDEPFRLDAFPRLAAYRFARVELSDGTQRAAYDNTGYCWVTERRRRAESGFRFALAHDRFGGAGLHLAQFGGIDPEDAYERASDIHDRYESYRDLHDAATRPADDSDIDALGDEDHYREGVESLGGDTSDRLGWIAEMHERLARALARATDVLNGMPDSSDDGPGGGRVYDPSRDVGLPGSSGVQRRGISGRGWD